MSFNRKLFILRGLDNINLAPKNCKKIKTRNTR